MHHTVTQDLSKSLLVDSF